MLLEVLYHYFTCFRWFCCFWFQKFPIFLGIARNKSQSPYFSRKDSEHRRGDTEGPRGGHTMCWHGSPFDRAATWCGPLGRPPTSPFAYKYPPSQRNKTLHQIRITQKVPQRRRHRSQVSGVRSSCSGTLPGRELTPGAISIDSTASTSTPWWFVSSSPLDYGFLAVASWYSLSHVLQYNDLMSCLTWLGSIWCNRCCVCWDPMNCYIMISLSIRLWSYCCCNLVVFNDCH